MPTPAAVLGSAGIGALGNIAGGILGASSGSEAANKAWKRQKYLLKYGPQIAVNAAKRAKLHPLTVLGMQPQQGPASSIGTDYGLGAAGQSIAAGLSRLQTADQKKIAEAGLRETNARAGYYEQLAANAKAENDRKNSITVPDPQGSGFGIRTVPDQVTATDPDNTGVTSGVHPWTKTFRDKRGFVAEYPADADLMESYPPAMARQAIRGGMDWAKGLKTNHKRIQNMIPGLTRRLRRNKKLAKNEKIVYDKISGQFRAVHRSHPSSTYYKIPSYKLSTTKKFRRLRKKMYPPRKVKGSSWQYFR